MTQDHEVLLARLDDFGHVDAYQAAATIRAQAAEIERLNAAIKRQAGAAATLRQATLEEVRRLQEKDRSEYVATQTLDSEREANAKLTAESDALRAEIARLSTPAGAAGVLLGVADTGALADLNHAVMDMIGVAAGHDDEIKVIDGVLDGLRALAAKEPAHD